MAAAKSRVQNSAPSNVTPTPSSKFFDAANVPSPDWKVRSMPWPMDSPGELSRMRSVFAPAPVANAKQSTAERSVRIAIGASRTSLFDVPSFALEAPRKPDGGEGGIRTLEALARLAVFKTAAFDRSATSPRGKSVCYDAAAFRDARKTQIDATRTGFIPSCR